MKAVYAAIAERGPRGLVIQDITESADVGFGTFYNHFTTKEAAADAVAVAAQEFLTRALERVTRPAGDGVEALALTLRLILHLSKVDREWGSFVVQMFLGGDSFRGELNFSLTQMLHAAIDGSDFNGTDLEVACDAAAGMLAAGSVRLISGTALGNYENEMLLAMLKTFGVRDGKARAALSKPFPDITPGSFLEANSKVSRGA